MVLWMGSLAKMSIMLGALTVLVAAPCAMVPEKAMRYLAGFYRSRVAGIVLAAVDMTWVGVLLYRMPWGRFEEYKAGVFILTPLSFFAVVVFMDELLAPRALGGLFLLMPAPVLALARWHESAFRYVIVLIAYAMVVKGFILTLSPYYYRKALRRFIGTETSCKKCGISGLVIGGLVILLGVLVY